MYNHNKAQQSKNSVHISCDILYYDLVIPSYLGGIANSKAKLASTDWAIFLKLFWQLYAYHF